MGPSSHTHTHTHTHTHIYTIANMSSSDSESDGHSGSSNRIKPFKTSTDYPLWAKLVLNHLAGHDLLDAVIDQQPLPVAQEQAAGTRIFVAGPAEGDSASQTATITVGKETSSRTDRDDVEHSALVPTPRQSPS
jgi:hypothetical protein